MTDNDIAYYRDRMDQETQRASMVSDPKVASVHRELAEGYRARLDSAAKPAPRPKLHLAIG